MKSRITTHVLDTSRGLPAGGIRVSLEKQTRSTWKRLGIDVTDADGRCSKLLTPGKNVSTGLYRLTFKTAAYFRSMRVKTFYPYVSITFEIRTSAAQYHVPLLLSPFGYATYRGS